MGYVRFPPEDQEYSTAAPYPTDTGRPQGASAGVLPGARRLLWLMLVALCAACGRSEDLRVEQLLVPAPPGSSLPHLAAAEDGTVVLSWVVGDGDAAQLAFSRLEDAGWSPPGLAAAGTGWFVNWADFPSVVPIAGDLWAAHWLENRPGGIYAYDIRVALSADAGASWTHGITPHRDGMPAEHGFVSLFPAAGGVGVLWLDGRDTVAEPAGGMTLRSAVVNPDLTLTAPALVDEMVCDCCQTDVASLDHGLLAVYRDRTATEVRDIAAVRGGRGGWESPRPVADDGWTIAGCPVNGPAVAARGATAVVGWYTQGGAHPRVQLARSIDGGRTFSTPTVIDDDAPIGRVAVALFADLTAAVAWLRPVGSGDAELLVAAAGADGAPGRPIPVAVTSAGRPAGFPQLAVHGDRLIVAWTDTSAAGPVVRSARLSMPALAALPNAAREE